MQRQNWTPEKYFLLMELKNEGKTYQEMGNHFGVSRQRIEQIIKKLQKPILYRGFYTLPTKGIRQDSKSGGKSLNSVYGKGKLAQDEFEIECSKRNIAFVPTWRTKKFDYLINKKKIEVKYGKPDKNGGVNITFKKNIFDIIALFLDSPHVKTWFFIPKKFLLKYRGGGFGITIGQKTYNSILKYRNKWESL